MASNSTEFPVSGAAPFPETDEDDAIGKWLLTLKSSQREKIFRLVAYLNPPRRRPRKAKRND